MDEDVTLAEVARRTDFSASWVRKLAETDPAFPPRRRIGMAWVVSWPATQAYFAQRNPKVGRPPKE